MTAFRSLRLRILLATMALLLLALSIALWLIAQCVAVRLEQHFDRSLTGYLNQVAAVVSDEQVIEKLNRRLMVGECAHAGNESGAHNQDTHGSAEE